MSYARVPSRKHMAKVKSENDYKKMLAEQAATPEIEEALEKDPKKNDRPIHLSKGFNKKLNNRIRLTEEEIQQEYVLIQEKKSKLSAQMRRLVVAYVEREDEEDGTD